MRKSVFCEEFEISKDITLLSLSLKMTTRSQKRKAVEEPVSVEIGTPIPENSQTLNPVAGTSKSPRVLTENLEEFKS